MLQSSRAIVLHTLRYSDGKIIATLLTEAVGRQTFVLHQPSGKRRSGLRTNFFQPLALMEIDWNHHDGKEMQQLRQARPIPLRTIPYDIRKTTIAMFLAECLNNALKGEPMTRDLFAYIYNGVEWLDEAAAGVENFHIIFLRRLIPWLGFEPNAQQYAEGCYFDLIDGNYTPTPPPHNHFLLPAEARLMPTLLRMNFTTAHVFTFTASERARLLQTIIAYYRLHLPSFSEPKSLEVLHDLFNS